MLPQLLLLLHFADNGQTPQTFLRLSAAIRRAALISPVRSKQAGDVRSSGCTYTLMSTRAQSFRGVSTMQKSFR
jgi:hypothetical protein